MIGACFGVDGSTVTTFGATTGVAVGVAIGGGTGTVATGDWMGAVKGATGVGTGTGMDIATGGRTLTATTGVGMGIAVGGETFTVATGVGTGTVMGRKAVTGATGIGATVMGGVTVLLVVGVSAVPIFERRTDKSAPGKKYGKKRRVRNTQTAKQHCYST